MKTKRGQSEIITTVLIILLVLAAIIIVWQVVQGTLRGASDEINTGASCIGLQTDIVSAKSAETLGTCSDATKTTKVACVAPETWTPAANGKVVVQKSSGNADSSITVTAKLYVAGLDTQLESTALSPLGTYEFTVPATTLGTPGIKVKAVTFLRNNAGKTAACGVAVEVNSE